MRRFLYLIGEPGIGKSTVMAELTRGLTPLLQPKPMLHTLWFNGALLETVELGRRREKSSGTDATSMGIQPVAVQWIEQRPYSRMMAEGDRLANDGFFEAVVRAGYNLHVIYLNGSVAAERRRARGYTQNPIWVRGRITKARNLAIRWKAFDVNVDGKSPAQLAHEMRLALDW